MLTPDLEALVSAIPFAQPAAARARLLELAGAPAELLALARLSEELIALLRDCADPDRALNNLERFVHARGARLQLYHQLEQHPAALEALIVVLAGSQYLGDVLARNPEYFDLLGDRTALSAPRALPALRDELSLSCAAFRTLEARLNAVRRFKRRELLRLGCADLLGGADLVQITAQLSDLAEAVVAQCLDLVGGAAFDPSSGRGAKHGLVVLALGKLGGGELNYSSDLDVLYVADAEAQVEALTPLARELTTALGAFSDEGFLYRVDLRLRPYGAAGPLVISAPAFRHYLQQEADPAERQAMLRARAIAGDLEAGRRLLEAMAPVIFAEGALARRRTRQLKSRIERQLRAQGRATGNVKLAPGGIRDVEFLVQALQLERGLAGGHTLIALDGLVERGAVPPQEAAMLRDAYVFLRVVEHRLQLMNNQQVHQLPRSERARYALARSLGFAELVEFRRTYDAHVQSVRELFERTLSVEGGNGEEAG